MAVFTKQNKTKQNKTKQNKTKQNKTKQNKTKQNKTKQNKTKQKHPTTKTPTPPKNPKKPKNPKPKNKNKNILFIAIQTYKELIFFFNLVRVTTLTGDSVLLQTPNVLRLRMISAVFFASRSRGLRGNLVMSG
jgi:DNA mismatch repair ATPase MutL